MRTTLNLDPDIMSAARKGKLATFDDGIVELIKANKERRQHITVIEA
jgi:hypothetical protein